MIRFLTSRFVAATALLVAATIAAFAQSLPVPSYWLNQRGSEMKLYSIDPQGNFLGIYINHAQGFACQGTPFALTGRATGANVTFRVVWQNAWQNCHSTTVWAGRVNGRSLPTDWVLSAPPSPPLFGKDLFTLQP
jgi:Avidin family